MLTWFLSSRSIIPILVYNYHFITASPIIGVSNSPVAITRNGTYVGLYSPEYNQDFFLGVPYAQTPVGNLRFSQPRSLNTSWSGIKSASEHRASCVGYGPDEIQYPLLSENCLYLYLVRPSGVFHKKLPVAIMIHGGGFQEGSSSDPRYNLTFLVDRSVKIGKPILAVSINYRMGIWGFISGKEAQKTLNTNLGLRDQRLALHWVQENIAAFGGDPSQVTIFGESAGAMSVGMHLTAYGGRDDHLFHRAMMQSGNPINYNIFNEDESPFENTADAVGCGSAENKLQCLREVPFQSINAYINGTGSGLQWAPVIDHDFIKCKTSLQIARGEFVHVPIVSGATSDEGTSFSPSPVDTEQDFLDIVEGYASPAPMPVASVSLILSAYPSAITYGAVPTALPFDEAHPLGANYRRAAAYIGDLTFIAARRLTCQTWTKFDLPVHCYRFNTIPSPFTKFDGCTHFQDEAFVLNNKDGVGYNLSGGSPFSNKPGTYGQLSDKMSSAWISFVYDGDPGDFWPTYGKQGHNFVFDADVAGLGYIERDDWRSEGIELINRWNSELYNR